MRMIAMLDYLHHSHAQLYLIAIIKYHLMFLLAMNQPTYELDIDIIFFVTELIIMRLNYSTIFNIELSYISVLTT